MSAPNDSITVYHGKLEIIVPRKIFKRYRAEIDREEYEKFSEVARNRYPWLTENAVEVIVKNAQREILREIDEKSGGVVTAKRFAEDNNYTKALARLERRLEENPNDYDAWYAYGEYLCKIGKIKEGNEAINKARSLVK